MQILFGLGDVIAQQGIQKKGIRNHDYAATARMATYGGCMSSPCGPCWLGVDGSETGVFGPAAVGWYRVLERYVVFKNRNAQMLARVALDQLGFAPVGIAAFFSAMSVMERRSPSQKLRESWWTALRANWNVWPAVQLVNFRFVPLDLRIVFVNVVSLGGWPFPLPLFIFSILFSILFFSYSPFHPSPGARGC